jgi:hypothetical protein
MMAISQINMNIVGFGFYYYADTGELGLLLLFSVGIITFFLPFDFRYIVFVAKLNFGLAARNECLVALGLLLIGTFSHTDSVSLDRVRNAFYDDLPFISDLHTNNHAAALPEPH